MVAHDDSLRINIEITASILLTKIVLFISNEFQSTNLPIKELVYIITAT